jgi:serine O-acetyltransferase
MVGIPAKPTLVDASETQRFVPYGTPCGEQFDPSIQKLEIMRCEIERLGKKIEELIHERDDARARLSGVASDRESA